MSLLNAENNFTIFHLLDRYKRVNWREQIKNFIFGHFQRCPDNSKPQLVLASEESVLQWVNFCKVENSAEPFHVASKTIIIDSVEHEIKVYTFENLDKGPIGIGFVIYDNIDEKMQSLNTYTEKLIWLYKNNLISKEGLVWSISFLTKLEQQQLHCLAKVNQDKPWFSILTHEFENFVNVMRQIENFTSTGSAVNDEKLMCKDGFILPINTNVLFEVKSNDLITVGSRNKKLPVSEQYFVNWREDDYTKGVILTQVNLEVDTSCLNKIFKPGYTLLKELINFGLKEEFKGCIDTFEELRFEFFVGERSGIQESLNHRGSKFVGSINLIKNEEGGYTIAPILNKENSDLVLEMFFNDKWDGCLTFIAPESCSRNDAKNMIREFLQYGDIDVDLVAGGVYGGGYTFTSISIRSLEQKFYQEDIDNGTIILGGKR